ncbi:extracellular matrix protein 2 [Lampris incognitus]|uniref:extracellular matrix protein 2 n=1 Tax=Lampris incognitus TaxID=2546036 RepID=UPI0024B4D05C|nr:extracellular matrix protein 2 [Lampris incognitus]
MRWLFVLAGLCLLVMLMLPETEGRSQPLNQDGEKLRGRRRRTGKGHSVSKAESSRPLNTRLLPGPNIPLNGGKNAGNPLFLQSYKSLPEQHSSYTIPGKQGQCVYKGLTMFDQAMWSPKPCVTCRCTGGRAVCDEISCPIMHCHFPFTPPGDCCPVCMEPVSDLSGDSPVPNDPGDTMTTLTQEEIQRILWHEEEEEEHLRRKERERKRRRKQRKEKAEEQRRLVEERRRQEEEALKVQEEKEEEEKRRRLMEEEEEMRRKQEEERRRKEVVEREAREQERKQEEERRRQEEKLREQLRALEEEEDGEEDEEEWLRGDVFQMSPHEPKEPDLLPAPIPRPPTQIDQERGEEEVQESRRVGLPPGCDVTDVTMTCDNAKLNYFPPLAMQELKSLSLEGNNISSIPAEAFNGIPNLEWINLGKNKLTSARISAKAFRSLRFLGRLYLDGNLLETIPLNLPPTLQELKINENKLRVIDQKSFTDLGSLVTLELEGNLLSEGTVDPLAFSHLRQLSYLRLGQNHFRTVPQGLPNTLLELYLENNLIEEISDAVFNQTTNLNVVSLRHNRLDETRIAPLAWINHRNLESIDLSHNELYLVPSYLPRPLVHLVLVGNHIERIPGYVFAHMDPGLEYLYLSYNRLDGEGVEPESFFGSYQSMVELCLDHNQLVNVPSGINEMNSLHFLRLNNNRIRNIPEDGLCDPHHDGDSTLVALRLENNFINPEKISPKAFSCVRSSSSVVLKPQRTK